MSLNYDLLVLKFAFKWDNLYRYTTANALGIEGFARIDAFLHVDTVGGCTSVESS